MTLKTIIVNRLAKLTIEGINDVVTLWNLDAQTIKGGGEKKLSKRELIKSVANGILDKGRLRKVVSSLSEREKQITNLLRVQTEDRLDSIKIGNTSFRKRDENWFAVYHMNIPKIFAHLRLLGLLEAGKICDNERDAFLLKPSFFGMREVNEERVKGIIVQPTFEIVALPETPEDVLFNLSRFSELKVADKVHIFTLTKKTLLTAIDKGMNTKKIIALLQNNAKTEIPQNVLYSIEEWSKLYGTVGLKKGVFLDADPELMQVMKKKMKEHLIKEISDSSVIIDGEGVLSSLMKEEAGVFIEVVDEIAAAEVEKAIRKYVLRKPSEKVFVIEAENIEKCRTALKKKGIFPKDFISEEKQMEETACESRNFRR